MRPNARPPRPTQPLPEASAEEDPATERLHERQRASRARVVEEERWHAGGAREAEERWEEAWVREAEERWREEAKWLEEEEQRETEQRQQEEWEARWRAQAALQRRENARPCAGARCSGSTWSAKTGRVGTETVEELLYRAALHVAFGGGRFVEF